MTIQIKNLGTRAPKEIITTYPDPVSTQGEVMPQLITTLGKYASDQLDLILPHEHIFVDLGPIEEENWKNARTEAVIQKIKPARLGIIKIGESRKSINHDQYLVPY